METHGAVAETVGGIVLLLVVAAVAREVTERIRVPFTVALVVVGVGLAELLEHGAGFLEPLSRLEMGPGVVFFIFLPALVFQSAFEMDARQLRENLGPVLALAVPGLLLSTGIFGLIIGSLTTIEWPAAFLLGALLSATDPVGVIALFRQLGAPVRLTVLVEGESLFNDATGIVLSRILVGVVMAGYLSWEVLAAGTAQFFLIFFGGIAVGWAAGLVVGWLLGMVEEDPFIEITLTTVLAYLSFLVAEEAFGVSGVMATVAAGILMGSWGRTKISPAVASYVEHFWEYMGFVANALIFLMVGLAVDLGALRDAVGLLGLAIAAMLVSRALVIYGLTPVAGRLPGAEPPDRRYQTVMFWGGLRGAVALAIALSLPEFQYRELFIALATGAVLFTLVVQGLTMEHLVHWLGLDQPPLSDKLARVEGKLAAKHRALQRIPELQEGGHFSARIAEELKDGVSRGIREMREELSALREREMDHDLERRLLFLRCFAAEKTLYYHHFGSGHVSERAYRDLAHSIQLQTEAIRHGNRIPEYTLHPPGGERFENVFIRFLDGILGFTGIPERLRISRTARDYEEAWGRAQGSSRVLDDLEEIARAEAVSPQVREEVRAYYQYWHENARERLDSTAREFPEFVTAMQERLGERLVLHAEREAIEEQAHAGTIPEGVAEVMLRELTDEIRELRAGAAARLRVGPEELLRKVPFFAETPPDEFHELARRLRPRTAPAGEAIIRQGEVGDSLYLIARGVIRVSRSDDGESRDLATLLAGDFFGEMALLHGERRTATCRAMTPCALYELRRDDLEAVRAQCPAIQEALVEADRRRKAELEAASRGAGASGGR